MRPQGGAVNQMGVGMTERWRRLAGLFALIAALTFAVAACGGGDDEGSGGTTTEASGAGAERSFPEFRIGYEPIDYMDPGLSYSVQGWGIMWNVYLGLLTYKHVDGPEGAELIPGLAEDLPEVSEDGLTYSFTLRDGLKYSDGSPVKASDFTSTVKRLFLIDSPGVGFFSGIVGAEQFSKTKKGEISGIVTDDDARTIEIKLAKPQGDFLHILAMVFAGFVPANTPAKDQSTTPAPGTGPYMVEKFVPNRSATVVRNPNYVEIDGVPTGNPDKMTFTIVEEDSASLQSVIDGNNDYSSHPIPVDRLGEVQNQYADQLKLYTPANTYYYFMNNRLAPFNKLEVRQAINYAIDREAIVRLYGGLATATENFLPPTYPQYKKISMYPHDLAKAKQLVQQSGTAGTAVTVWSSTRETHQKAAEYLTDILNQLGYKAKLRAIDPAIYWATIGTQRTKAQTGLANWFQDYPHPLNWFDTLLNGNRITEEHNNNYSNADVAAVNDKIEELKLNAELNDELNAQWAEVDQMVLENAVVAPFVNRQFTDFFTAEMDLDSCYVNHVLYQFDYIQSCKKG
jgi:peptide/nickel transport system substrate-binding protein